MRSFPLPSRRDRNLTGKQTLSDQTWWHLHLPTSTLVRLLHKSEDAEGTIIEVDLDYVIPIANKVINAENHAFHAETSVRFVVRRAICPHNKPAWKYREPDQFTNCRYNRCHRTKKTWSSKISCCPFSAPTARNAMSTITQRNNIFLPVTSQASSRKIR